jgi:hypothetical protein
VWEGDYLRDNSRTPSLRTSHFSCKFNLHFSSPPQYFLPPYSHLSSSYTSSSSKRSFMCQTAATVPRHLYHHQCRTNCGKRSESAGPVRESVLPAVASRPALTASRGNKADHSPSSSAAVNNAWSSASSPLRHHENVLHEGQRQLYFHLNITPTDIYIPYDNEAGAGTVRVRTPVWERNFYPLENVQTGTGDPTSLLFNGYPGSFPGVKAPGREANSLSPSSAHYSPSWCGARKRYTDMHRLTTGICSEKCVVRRFRRCANVIVYLHKPRKYSITYYSTHLGYMV